MGASSFPRRAAAATQPKFGQNRPSVKSKIWPARARRGWGSAGMTPGDSRPNDAGILRKQGGPPGDETWHACAPWGTRADAKRAWAAEPRARRSVSTRWQLSSRMRAMLRPRRHLTAAPRRSLWTPASPVRNFPSAQPAPQPGCLAPNPRALHRARSVRRAARLARAPPPQSVARLSGAPAVRSRLARYLEGWREDGRGARPAPLTRSARHCRPSPLRTRRALRPERGPRQRLTTARCCHRCRALR